jgi:hypothetical protein
VSLANEKIAGKKKTSIGRKKTTKRRAEKKGCPKSRSCSSGCLCKKRRKKINSVEKEEMIFDT